MPGSSSAHVSHPSIRISIWGQGQGHPVLPGRSEWEAESGVQRQAQPPFRGKHPGTFWEWSLLYTKCQPHGAVSPLVMPQASPGPWQRGGGFVWLLQDGVLRKNPLVRTP